MAARAKSEEVPEEVPTESQADVATEPVAYDAQGNPLPEEPAEEETSGPFVDTVDSDLTDPDTGKPAPVSATTDQLQGTLSNTNGRVLVKIAVRGYIGEEPVVLLAAHAGEFAELVSKLEEALGEQKARFAKSENYEASEA